MSKETFLGGMVGGATAGALGFLMLSNAYYGEITRDAEAAATAKAFSSPEHVSEFQGEIAQAITALETKYDTESAQIPEACLKQVTGREPQSVAEINFAGSCAYSDEMVEAVQGILEDIQDRQAALEAYLGGDEHPGVYSTLEDDVAEARLVVADAADQSLLQEMEEGSIAIIDASLDPDNKITKSSHQPGNFTFVTVGLGGILTVLSGLASGIAADTVADVRRRNKAVQSESTKANTTS
jgi:hypothetical protein